MGTVSPVRRLLRHPTLASGLGALAAAELAARLLAPRGTLVAPAEIALERYFSAEEIARGARFARPQLALGLARGMVDGLVLGLVARRSRRTPVRARAVAPVAGGALTGAALSLALVAAPLPLAVVARRRAIAVGLVTQSWRGWALDLLKSSAIGSVLAGGAGAAVTALTRRYPRGWWLPAAGGSVGVGALFAALGPVLLDPVFNEFTPLPEGSQRREDVLALARAARVRVGEVYSIDASRRTTAANAYVTGLGPTKRVVLFDTLLNRYTRDEVRVVVAHELSHVRHRDVARSLLYAALAAPPAALAVQRLSWTLSPRREGPEALPALALAAALVSAPTGLIANRLSRAVERRADQFSLELSEAPEAFVSFERAIALQNVADLDPPWWVRRVLATHPPTSERIGAAVAWSARRDRRPAPPIAEASRPAGRETPAGS